MGNPKAGPTSDTAVGIDLGTCKSTAAYVGGDGRPVILVDANNRPLLVRTALYFGDQISVGEPAIELGATNPDLYVESFKREMGKPHFHRPIRQRRVPPEVLSAFVLQWLKRESQRNLGKVDKAVITVPAYFSEAQRKATQEAGRLAGFAVLGIINEPTAAAVACGYLERRRAGEQALPDQTIMVYDFGGGTFDVSILCIQGRKFSTLATDGDIQLGGYDFDERLADFLAERFLQRHGADPRGDAASMHQLLRVAQDAKHRLTQSAKVTVECRHAGLRMGSEVTREQFEDLVEPFVERTLTTCLDVLQEARLDWPQVDRILLVGGSSQVPLVARRLQEMAGKSPILPENPELLVAYGAALHAALRSEPERLSREASFDIVNVNAHSLGIGGIDVRNQEPINTILIPRNTPLPASAVRKFVTRRDNQANVAATVLEGESENPKFCTPIGKCIVQLEPNLPAGTEVEVSCHYRADGLIFVAARVPLTKHSAQVELRRDRVEVADPLSVWETRLTLGEEPAISVESAADVPEPPDEPIGDSPSFEQLMRRLDFLYTQIGKRTAQVALPAGVLPVQRMIQPAFREVACIRQMLDQLGAKHDHATDRQERRQLSVLIARARAYHSQAATFASHAVVVLGREALAVNICPHAAEAFRQEAQQIVGRLREFP